MELPIRLAAFNAENFSLLLDKPYSRQELDALSEADYLAMNSSILNPNKERAKIAEIGVMVLRGGYDVVGLCEVGGRESLAAFNRLYLDNGYEVYLHEENSKRGIFVGALVKRPVFLGARGKYVGGFRTKSAQTHRGQERGGVEIFVVHLKSQFGQDRGLEHRIREIEKLCSLVGHKNASSWGTSTAFSSPERPSSSTSRSSAAVPRCSRGDRNTAEQRRTHYHFGPEPHFTHWQHLLFNNLQVIEAGVVEEIFP